MTEIFKAGEHVKIVRTDSAYADELGDQTGLVGTVAEGTDSGNAYVTFPHTGDAQFYYIRDEFERAHGTTPAPEPLKRGDWVKVVNYTDSWDDTIGKITKFHGSSGAIIVNESHKTGLCFNVKNLELTEEPIPAPKFKVGDWVEVTGYGNTWDGVKGQVTKVGHYDVMTKNYSYIIKTHDFNYASAGGFVEKYLKATTKPEVNKFKVGDWVEITGWASSWDGQVHQIRQVPTKSDRYYRFVDDSASGFTDTYLKLVEEPHWTVTKPVGAAAQVSKSDDRFDRILVKISKTYWLHIYQGADGTAGVTATRDNGSTQRLITEPYYKLNWLDQ